MYIKKKKPTQLGLKAHRPPHLVHIQPFIPGRRPSQDAEPVPHHAFYLWALDGDSRDSVKGTKEAERTREASWGWATLSRACVGGRVAWAHGATSSTTADNDARPGMKSREGVIKHERKFKNAINQLSHSKNTIKLVDIL